MEPSEITTYQAGATQAYMHRKMQKVCDIILRPYSISKMQWLIIGHVLDAGEKGVRISDLSEVLGTTMSYLTNSVNLLESRGILQRRDNANDTRSRMIVVSQDYVPVCREIEVTLREGLRKTIYAKVDPKEFAVYLKVMEELAAVPINDE
jgi:DNA-binding MarR family transcriptional regulator